MKLAVFELKITIVGPVVTQSSAVGQFGFDAVPAQTRGHYYLPGSLIKGLLGEAMTELNTLCGQWPLGEWLGKSSEENLAGPGVDPSRGRVQFSDLLDETPVAQRDRGVKYRIRIDDVRGSVDKGAYLVIDAPFASGENITFSGTVRARLKENETAGSVRKALLAGLRWISSVGAERSVGFGRIDKVELTLQSEQTVVPAAMPNPKARYRLTLNPSAPLCIPKRRVGTNLFECEDAIPGSAIRGAIAEMIQGSTKFKALLDQLHLVRVTHAFPAKSGSTLRPARRPLSLCSMPGEGELRDVRTQADPPKNLSGPPAFDIDWKAEDWQKVPACYAWPDLEKELRVRTAVEGEKRKAAEAELFAYRVIPPGQCVWLADADLSRVTDDRARCEVASCLTALEGCGLWGLGKTKAAAELCVQAVEDPALPPHPTSFLAITLQTPALLLDPRPLASAMEKADYKELYQQAWDRLAGKGVLELRHCFQRVSLAGGQYLAERFQPGQNYWPYLLTDPGSIFVFEVIDTERAKAVATQWLRQGLKASGKGLYFQDESPDQLWKECPYIPENGYGEVRIEWVQGIQ
ncbi:MAG: RAMP superfamily CRISPR-associated protein [Terriglobia bacterium]